MDALKEQIGSCLSPGTVKCVLCHPASAAREPRITFRNIGGLFQREVIADNQAFHKNFDFQQCLEFICAALEEDYRQLNIWDAKREHCLRISKKGKVSVTRKQIQQAPRAKATA